MKTWKKFTMLCASAAITFFPSQITNGCGGYDDFLTEGYLTFLAPEVFSLAEYGPLFFTHRAYYKYEPYNSYGSEDTLRLQENVTDWRKYFKNNASWNDIQALIYDADTTELSTIQNFCSGKSKKLKDEWSSNSLVQTLKKKNRHYSDLLPYLQFIRKCEPYTSSDNSYNYDIWENEEDTETALESETGIREESRTSKIQKLIQLGLQQYQAASSDFMKMRYGYQLVRLAHYASDYNQCIELYDRLVAPLTLQSPIHYWALAHKAGALLKKDQSDEALYLFSVVYTHSPSYRIKAYDGFQRYGGGVCKECLGYAKNKEEKVGILTLQALTLDLTPASLQAMQEIYTLDPTSENLELLLVRELNKMESGLVSDNFDEFDRSESKQIRKAIEILPATEEENSPATKATYDLSAVQQFIQKTAAANNTRRPYLWKFAVGYQAFLVRDFRTAQTYFAEVKKLHPKDELLLKQLHLLEIIQRFSELQQVSNANENSVLADLQWLQKEDKAPLRISDARDQIYAKLKQLYYAQGNEIHYSLITGGEHFSDLPDYAFNEKMIHFLKNSPKTALEQFYLQSYEVKVDQLHLEQGKIQLSNYQFADAVETLKKIENPKVLKPLMADPFIIHIKDCHDCDFDAYRNKKQKYNALTFAQRMVELQTLIKQNPANAAQYHFLLGNALYNLTYYGNNWSLVTDWSRSDYEKMPEIKPSAISKNQYNVRNIYDCLPAQKQYDSARLLAKNKEFEAQLAFLAAKCEQNRFYISPENNRDESLAYDDVQVPAKYRSNFRLLKSRYAKTKYYQEIINECGYFANYVGGKPQLETITVYSRD